MHNQSNDLENILNTVKGHIQEFLECGPSALNNSSNIETHSNNGYFLGIIVRVRNFWWGLINQVLTAYKEDLYQRWYSITKG